METGLIAPRGLLKNKVIRCPGPGLAWHLRNRLRWGFVWGWIVYHIAPILAKILGTPIAISRLGLRVKRTDGRWINYGWVGYKCVTTAGVNALVLGLINQANAGAFFYHGIGTGGTAEAAADTTLVTEITTAYNPDSTRATGTHVQGGTANIYRTVGTNTVDGSVACTEHGVFTQAATGGGTLLDRTLFSVVNLASGDGLQSTYELTLTAGS